MNLSLVGRDIAVKHNSTLVTIMYRDGKPQTPIYQKLFA